MIAVNAASPVGWIILVIALITAVVVAVIKNWDKIKETLGKVGDWINEHIIQPVKNFFSQLFNLIVLNVVVTWTTVKNAVIGVANWIYTHIIKPIIDFFVQLWTNIKTGVTNLWNGVISVIQGVANWVNTRIIQPISSFFSNMWSAIQTGLQNVGNFFSNIFNGMRNIASTVINAIIGFFTTLGNTAHNVINGIWNVVKSVINFIIRGINVLIRGLNKIHFSTPDWVPSIGGKSFGFNIPQVQYLKSGGIINMPNKGVNLGGAVGGESGREGVLPLTDIQAMQQLGQEIGKHITINANVVNTMNGRVLSRVMQEIKQEEAFASNS